MSEHPFDPMDPVDVPALAQSNAARIETLARQGVNIDTGGKLLLMILEHVLPSGSLEREEFDRRWETDMADALDQIEAQVRQSRLLQGVDVPNGNGRGGLV